MSTITTPPVIAQETRGVLPVMLAATFMISVDFFIVNVALPAMQQDLHAGPSALQWVIAGFGLALGAGLITSGRLGDRYGRRRVFSIGLALFTLASLLCGIAPTAGILIGSRVLQGLAAALMTPQILVILRTTFTGAAQAKAFSLYGLTLGLGAVFGQVIGGLLIKADPFGTDWRACFLINLPVGIGALALVKRTVPESYAPERPKLDLVGVGLVSAALVALVLPLIQGREQGWPLWTWLSLAGSAVLFTVFVRQQRTGSLVNLHLFKERAFTTGLAATQLFWMGQASFFLVLALYLQFGRGLSALESGTVFMAIGLGYMATAVNAHHLARILGRQVVTVGAVVMALGLLLMWEAASASSIGWLLPGLVVDGLGMGVVLAPLTTTVLARVTPQNAGSAAGVLSTVQQVGNALGVALIGIVFYSAQGYVHAFEISLLVLVVLELALAAMIQLLPRA